MHLLVYNLKMTKINSNLFKFGVQSLHRRQIQFFRILCGSDGFKFSGSKDYIPSFFYFAASAVLYGTFHANQSNNSNQAACLSNQNMIKFLSELKEVLAEDSINLDEDDRHHHGKPMSSYHQIEKFPDVVVYPSSKEEVSGIAKLSSKYKVPIIPYGGATSIEGHLLAPEGGVSIDFSKMNKVIKLNKSDHDVTVQPGLGYLELNSILKEENLWFPLDPGPGASIGGMTATRCSGSTAVRYGTMRENVISLEAVLPNGDIIKTGGRAKKSSAGYDLTRLIIGSEGTLGIITKITLKVHKIPSFSTSIRVSFDSVYDASKTVQEILSAGIQVGRAELLDDTMMKILNKANKKSYKEKPTILLEIAGESSDSVNFTMKIVSDFITKNNPLMIEYLKKKAECDEMWRERKEALWAAMGQYPECEAMTTDVCVPLSKLPELISAIKEEIGKSWLAAPIVAHAGDGNIHCLIIFDSKKERDLTEANRLSSFMVQKAIGMEGTCTGEHGIGTGKIQYMPLEFNEATLNMMGSIKGAIDPNNIMNPGKILPSKNCLGFKTNSRDRIS
mmetsp:Transcript_6223/g.9312  ORF Transcript_6223/g.9312 Transcript_6223/m.9312 type:complete len:560 (+) Transcript_6223:58-1737(+)